MDNLLKQIKDSNQNGFKEFYHLLFFKMYQFAYSFVHSKEVAEEIVNDVFLALWQKRETITAINNIQVYLYVSVKNACLNYLRRRRLPISDSLDELSVDHLRFTADPEILLTRRELRKQIDEAIKQLPPRCRLIFNLVKEDGLSYKEVSSILNISVKTVDSQLCLALKKLAARLRPSAFILIFGFFQKKPFPL